MKHDNGGKMTLEPIFTWVRREHTHLDGDFNDFVRYITDRYGHMLSLEPEQWLETYKWWLNWEESQLRTDEKILGNKQ
jgi:hypothetical protein